MARATPNLLAPLYLAEWQADHAGVLVRKGDSASALNLLVRSSTPLLASDYQPGRLHYFSTLSAAQLTAGDSNGALNSSLAAIREADKSVPALRSATEKEQWQRKNAEAYEQLVAVQLRRGNDAEALETWERFRRLPFLSMRFRGDSGTEAADSSAPASLALVLALIDQTYVGWLVDAHSHRMVRRADLGGRQEVQALARTLYHLCSDRDSNLTDVRAVGGRLYSLLFDPFSDKLRGVDHLLIEVDPSLEGIPFPALSLPSGSWAGDALRITLLPPWWSVQPHAVEETETVTPASRMLILNGLGETGAYSEAAGLISLFPHATLLNGDATSPQAALQSLALADIVHFSGHAVSDGESRFLLETGAKPSMAVSAEALAALHLRHCAIAVLAACNTTAYDPNRVEPLLDLRNALLLSGAHAVIASRWDVDDHSTEALTLALYKQLLRGNPAAESLQVAQQLVRSEPQWKHPYYWASFELFTH